MEVEVNKDIDMDMDMRLIVKMKDVSERMMRICE